MEHAANIGIEERQLDANGYVTVWDVGQGKWIKRSPIDAKEGLATGALTRHAPEDEAEQEPASESEIEDVLVSMTKSELQQACTDQNVAFTAADTKSSLIERLLVAGFTIS